MSAHTPGPWEEIPQHGAGPMIAHKYATGKQMNPIGLRLVCHILMRGNSMDEDQANARLIAAAPTLLDACEAAWNCVIELPPSNATSELVRMLADALARARGEQP